MRFTNVNATHERIHFTIQERILLHLIHFINLKNEIEVPINMTQQGIAIGVGIQKKHVPRSLKVIIEKGFLSERMAHVIGKPQRMKSYFLTRNGVEEALKLKNYLMDLSIKVKDGKGSIKEMAVMEIVSIINGPYTLGEVVSNISPEGIFDIEKLKDRQKEGKKETLSNNLTIYKRVLTQAWKDERITSDEREILQNLRESLNITQKNHLRLEEEILKKVEKKSDRKVIEVYQTVLEQALVDGKITEDEKAILEMIKKRFHIR
jgi:hypothetical protein